MYLLLSLIHIYPDEVIDRLARAFYPAILACWNSEEGQREFAAWQAEQAHHAPSKEKQSVPDGEQMCIRDRAYGAYTHHELSVLVTVLTRRQALQLRNFLRENDPRSFITIVNSSEIIGKGFRSFN